MNVNEIFKKYDPKSQAKWYEYEGAEFLIAPMDNPHYKKELTKTFTLKEAMAINEGGPQALEGTANEAIGRMYKFYSNSLVLDWKEVKDDEKVMKFSAAKVHEWMMDNDEFANFIILKSVACRDELAKEKEEVAKN